MNHKWENNKCLKCGIERQMKHYKSWQRVETVLVNGIWQDKHFYTYGTKWHYGTEHKFERPNCKLLNKYYEFRNRNQSDRRIK